MHSFFLKTAAASVVMSIALIVRLYADSDIQEFTPQSNDRILILAPHPDDESLCCGGVIREALENKAGVKIVFLTHGDDNEWSFLISEKKPVLTSGRALKMGMVRSKEAVAAAAVLGVPEEDIVFLGYPDSGIMPMWNFRWKNSQPYSGFLTKADAVPYQNAYREGAAYKSEEILEDLKSILSDYRPTRIFVSHPADRNADHRALYLFTRVALWDLHMQTPVYPYLIHYKKWPRPKSYDPHRPMRPPKSLTDRIRWSEIHLSADQTGLKYKAIQKHRTQMSYSKKFMSSFVKSSEIFGGFPDIPLGNAVPKKSEQPEDRTGSGWESRLSEEIEDLFFRRDLVSLENGQIVIRVNLSSLLSGTLKLALSVHGYSSLTPFSEMPKLNIRCGIAGCEVYDGMQKMQNSYVNIDKKPGYTTIRIPVKDAGSPQKVFIGMSTLLGDRTTKVLPGRIFNLLPETGKDTDS